MTPDPHFCYSMLTAPEKHVQGLSRAGHEQHRRLQPKRSIRDRLLRLSCRASANARGTGSESVYGREVSTPMPVLSGRA